MSEPTPRRTPTNFASARAFRRRAELPPALGFPWFEVDGPLVFDGEVLREQPAIPTRRSPEE